MQNKTVSFSSTIKFLIYGFMLALLAACAGQTHIESDLGIEDAPDWVNEGTQAVSDQDGRLIQGVGSAPPMGDFALQKSTSESRARAEVARILSSYMDVVLNDYLASAGQAESAEVSNSVQQQINTVTKVVLSGSRIVGNWKDPETKVIYAFAELDVKQVEERVKTTEQLNQGLKDYMSENSSQLFEQFANQ